MPARRSPSPTARARILATAALCALALTACGSDDPTVATTVPTTVTPVTKPAELSPRSGSVRATVDGIDSLGDAEADETPEPDPPQVEPLRDVLLVGDSVLALVADDLAIRIDTRLHVDGVDCRRLDRSIVGPCGGVPNGVAVDSGVDAVRANVSSLAADGVTPDSAVFVLANNSSITRTDLDAVMAATAGIAHVWWVNTRIEGFGRQDLNNRLLDDLADDDPRAGVIDWFSASEGQGWLSDNVHPNEAGQVAMARLVREHLRCRCTP